MRTCCSGPAADRSKVRPNPRQAGSCPRPNGQNPLAPKCWIRILHWVSLSRRQVELADVVRYTSPPAARFDWLKWFRFLCRTCRRGTTSTKRGSGVTGPEFCLRSRTPPVFTLAGLQLHRPIPNAFWEKDPETATNEALSRTTQIFRVQKKNGSKRSSSSTRAELVADNQASVPESLGWGEGECAAHARDCAVAFSPHHGAPREGPARGKRGEWPAGLAGWLAGSLARGAAAFGRGFGGTERNGTELVRTVVGNRVGDDRAGAVHPPVQNAGGRPGPGRLCDGSMQPQWT